MTTVIFACIHNAGRSQMAAAWFNALADTTKARAVSAGTEPGARAHPEVLEAMREVGIELSDRKPQKLTDDLARSAQMLVTNGVRRTVPGRSGSASRRRACPRLRIARPRGVGTAMIQKAPRRERQQDEDGA